MALATDAQESVTSVPAALQEYEVDAEVAVHEAYWYEPESTPLEQVRVSEAHAEPCGTVLAWYAVTLAPCAIVWLLNVQD